MFEEIGCVKQVEQALSIVKFIGFSHEEFGELRIVMCSDFPWFVASDVCRALKLSDVTSALRPLDDKEKLMLNIGSENEYSAFNAEYSRRAGNPNVNCINEYGLYRLVFRSRKKVAKKFQDWVLYEVLPSIRKYGAYINVKHPDIRQLSKDIRNKLESAIGILIKCRCDELSSFAKTIKNIDDEETKKADSVEDAVFKFITSRINKAVGLKSHERDAADTKTLLNLIRYETYAIEAILSGLYSKKTLQHIINLCGYKSVKKLGLFEYSERLAA